LLSTLVPPSMIPNTIAAPIMKHHKRRLFVLASIIGINTLNPIPQLPISLNAHDSTLHLRHNGELSEITAGWHACMPRQTGFALERFIRPRESARGRTNRASANARLAVRARAARPYVLITGGCKPSGGLAG
jgi:hypothetical protein